MKKVWILCCIAILGYTAGAIAQKKITLEDIWQNRVLSPKTVPGFNFLQDGKHFTRLENNKIEQFDLTTGNWVQTLLDAAAINGAAGFSGEIDDYHFSDDEQKILIESEQAPIYRHSYHAKYYVYDRKSKSLTAVFDQGKQRLTTLNPQGDKAAFVFENNLYMKDLASGQVKQITTDGKANAIINGATDWVYEEEFSFDKGFQWSPDGRRIAFYRFDETRVPEFTMTNFRGDLYPENVTFKYPKVGQPNAQVTIHLYEVETDTKIDVATYRNEDHYIPRIKWTQDPYKLCVLRMNRHQSELELLLADARSGKTSLLLKETSKYYIDIHDNLTFLDDGKHFIWTSEADGWNHIYLYDLNGKVVQQLTGGQYEVTAFYGVDEKRRLVYYQAAEKSPVERQVYSVSLDGKRKQQLADAKGWNDAQFSSSFDYFVLTHSTANTPATYTVCDREGKTIRVIEDNAVLRNLQKEYSVSSVEFFSFMTSESIRLNGWMIKPKAGKENLSYPVLMFVYGGPGSQEAIDQWMGANYWWFQMLAQQGYIVACVDNRGTGGRGEAFKKMTYLQLGKYETIDQIEAAKYLGTLKFVDPKRIGIFGWSYGGYMSSLCLLKGADVFKAAIAVAPVTNWKWYDTIYTERFMRTEQENPDGYRDNSPVNFARNLKGHYLLVHGMGDDNVHFQHAAEMVNALVDANKQFDTYYYPNRNHGIYGGNTRLHLYTKMTDFLNDNLKGPVPASKKVQGPIKIVPAEAVKE